MRRMLVWFVAGLLELSDMTAAAQPPKARARRAASAPFPPYRLAGPALAEPVSTPAPTPAPTPEPTAATSPTPAPTTQPLTPAPPITPAPASEEALDTLAQQHYKTGVDMYQNRLYDAARAEFEAAYKLLPLPDLLHNLSMVTEQQGQLAAAVSYEERFAVAAPLTHSERATTKARIARLREQAGMPPAPSTTATETETAARPTATERGRTPTGALALIGIGSGMLLTGIGCGIGAFVTQGKLESGEPLFLREIDAYTARGQALNAAGIAFDVAGGVVLVAGSAWALAARARSAKPRVTALTAYSTALRY